MVKPARPWITAAAAVAARAREVIFRVVTNLKAATLTLTLTLTVVILSGVASFDSLVF